MLSSIGISARLCLGLSREKALRMVTISRASFSDCTLESDVRSVVEFKEAHLLTGQVRCAASIQCHCFIDTRIDGFTL
jgi:hypothetical protein